MECIKVEAFVVTFSSALPNAFQNMVVVRSVMADLFSDWVNLGNIKVQTKKKYNYFPILTAADLHCMLIIKTQA